MYYKNISYKFPLFFIKVCYGVLHLFVGKRRKFPRKNFEENPRTLGWRGALYLGYKCYYSPHTTTNDALYTEKYFRHQKIPLTDVAPQKNELVINIAGDMKQYALFNVETTKYLRDDIGEKYFNADTVIANLETPIDFRKKIQKDPLIMLHDIYFNAHKNFYNIFSDHEKQKYSLLLTANNHCLDQGQEGNIMTCKFLEEYKIPYIGSRLTKKKPRYYIIDKKGIKVAYINYTFSCNQNLPNESYAFAINYLRLNKVDTDITQITEDVVAAKKSGADFVIFCPHMGNAYQLYPSGHIVRMVHRFFDECGVDAVICTHPHNIQPMEIYNFVDPHTNQKKQGFVMYSLGDFVSYDVFSRSHLSAILQLRIKKIRNQTSIVGIQVVPLYMHMAKRGNDVSFRLLDLEKLIIRIKRNDALEYICASEKKEIEYAYTMFHNRLLPGK